MKKREHLPFMGVGPLIVCFQVAVTAVGIVLSSMGYLSFSQFEALDIPLKVVGTMMIFFGVYLYFVRLLNQNFLTTSLKTSSLQQAFTQLSETRFTAHFCYFAQVLFVWLTTWFCLLLLFLVGRL